MEKEESGLPTKKTEAVFEMNSRFGLEFREKQCFDCFFYADTEDDSNNLAIDLHKLGYHVEVYKADGRDRWSIIGTTPEISADMGSVARWSEEMETLAKAHQADFDGWGSEAG